MDLYFSPLACSLAARIALYDAGADARYIYVDGKKKRTGTGDDYLSINPLGLVPALRLENGVVLTENAAILAYLAETLHPAGGALERALLSRWIGFINSELHTGAFSAILDPGASEQVRAYALAKARTRFAYLDALLADRDFLTGEFSVADAYLFVVLNWTQVHGPALADYPHLGAYRARVAGRDSVKRAMGEEIQLYQEEAKRRAA